MLKYRVVYVLLKQIKNNTIQLNTRWWVENKWLYYKSNCSNNNASLNQFINLLSVSFLLFIKIICHVVINLIIK